MQIREIMAPHLPRLERLKSLFLRHHNIGVSRDSIKMLHRRNKKDKESHLKIMSHYPFENCINFLHLNFVRSASNDIYAKSSKKN